MPAVSKRQWRWMWATDQEFADRWATRGRYRGLPEKKRSAKAMSPSEAARTAALARWEKQGRKPKAPPKAKEKPAPVEPPTSGSEAQAFLSNLGLDSQLSESLGEYFGGQMGDEPEDVALSRAAANALAAQGLIRIPPGQEDASNVTIELTGAGRSLQASMMRGDTARAMSVVERGHERAGVRAGKDKERQAKLAANDKAKQDKAAATAQDAADKEKKGGGGGGGSKEEKKPVAKPLKGPSTSGALGTVTAAGAGRAGEAAQRQDKQRQDLAKETQRQQEALAKETQRKQEAEQAKEQRKQEAEQAKEQRKQAQRQREVDDLSTALDDWQKGRTGLSYRQQSRAVRLGLARYDDAGNIRRVTTPAAKAEDSVTPPAAVQAAARQALAQRQEQPPSNRGGTAVGLARARDLANGRPLSRRTVRRMKAFFDRHQGTKPTTNPVEDSKWQQAQGLWGGPAGYRWARRIVAEQAND